MATDHMFIIEHFTNSKTKLSAGPDPSITTDPVHQKTHGNVKVHAATVPGTKMSPDNQTSYQTAITIQVRYRQNEEA